MRSLSVGVLLCALLLCAVIWASPADAVQIFGAGAIYGSDAQVTGVCYLFNAGDTTVTIYSIAIFDEVANDYVPVSNSCGATLLKHRTCRTVARVFSGIAYSCRATVSSAVYLRGSLELRDTAGTVLSNTPMR